ncbi:MAG: FdhF/YdeP family oxidoreductase [Planctomycetia bacterium]|nr:FdhF/YdeP family oxidoreductase [Planctomycetia bacterium]
MRKTTTGGGWPAVLYTLRKAREVGGILKLWKAMRSKNACKTCALGMGGQAGGMVNEAGHFPEVCKKSLQAMASDMQGAIRGQFFETYSLAQLQAFSPRELETCGRLTTPLLVSGDSQYYRPIDWNEALQRIVDKLAHLSPHQSFWYLSGRSSNEAGFVLQLLARLYGTNNVNNCSYYCHQASGVGLTSALGIGTATVSIEDVEGADLVFIIGGNPASNHPRLMRTLMQVRRNAGQVIVINPVVETGMVNFSVPSDLRSLLFGSQIASLYVQPDIGGDLALLTGVAKRVDELGAVDAQFLAAHCDGWDQLQSHLRSLNWDEICAKSGVDRQQIDEIARRYAAAKRVVFGWTMGITHHVHGVSNVQAIANLALMRGMVGRPRTGLLPIRGHSNVQGMGSVGVTPKLKQIVLERLQSHFGVQLPTEIGLDTMGCIEAARAGQLKFGFCLGGNLYGSNPDAAFVAKALQRLEMVVYLNTTLNTGHAHGLANETIILPVLARDEEPQPTTQESMFSYVRLSDGGPARHSGPRSEVEIVAELGRRLLGKTGPIDWDTLAQTREIRSLIGHILPGWEKISQIDQSKQEFRIAGRRLAEPLFATANGRAQMHLHELPIPSGEATQLRLMTVRSEGQFNTVVYEDYDLYRGQDRRDVILMHPSDLERLGLRHDMSVVVRSEAGAVNNVLARSFGKIKPGNALMYYPEANRLVPRHVDPASRTPAFKNVLVTVMPVSAEVGEMVAPTGKDTIPKPNAAGDLSTRDRMRAC